MNIFGIVAPLVAAINPRETLTIYAPVGYVTAADGARTPNTAAPAIVLASVQNADYETLQQNGGVNLSSENLVAYLPGNWTGVVRADQKDGSIIVRADGSRWLVISVAENWQFGNGWTRVLMTRQLNS